MKLNEFMQLSAEIRENIAFLAKQIKVTPNVQEMGTSTFVDISNLLKKTHKKDLITLVNALFIKWETLEKIAKLHFHVNDKGQIAYFTLPTNLLNTAREWEKLIIN